MQELIRQSCPYCGEPIELLVDCSVSHQEYVEDCQVCCRPMEVWVEVDSEGDVTVQLARDED